MSRVQIVGSNLNDFMCDHDKVQTLGLFLCVKLLGTYLAQPAGTHVHHAWTSDLHNLSLSLNPDGW